MWRTLLLGALGTACATAPARPAGTTEVILDDGPGCQLPRGADLRHLELVRQGVKIIDRHYGGPEVPYQAMLDGALAALAAGYPGARLPRGRRADSLATFSREIERAARHARCSLLLVAPVDPGPEHALLAGALQALPWPGGEVRVDERTVAPRDVEAAAVKAVLPPRPVQRNHERMLAGGVLYIGIATLDGGLRDHLRAVFRSERLPADLRGVIVDLRGCGGGLVDEAVGLSDHFLAAGELLRNRGRRGTEAKHAVARGDDVTLPLAVLVDGETAAGAEVAVAALQHHDRALVVGEPTQGHGIVTVRFDLRSGAALFLPIAELLRPDGRPLHGNGIQPDVTPAANGERDPVLSRAEAILARAHGASRRELLAAAAR